MKNYERCREIKEMPDKHSSALDLLYCKIEYARRYALQHHHLPCHVHKCCLCLTCSCKRASKLFPPVFCSSLICKLLYVTLDLDPIAHAGIPGWSFGLSFGNLCGVAIAA